MVPTSLEKTSKYSKDGVWISVYPYEEITSEIVFLTNLILSPLPSVQRKCLTWRSFLVRIGWNSVWMRLPHLRRFKEHTSQGKSVSSSFHQKVRFWQNAVQTSWMRNLRRISRLHNKTYCFNKNLTHTYFLYHILNNNTSLPYHSQGREQGFWSSTKSVGYKRR